MRVLILLVFIGVAVALPKQRPQRIVGGEQTSIEEYPYMSSMMYTIWGVWFYQGCGGSLLTSRTVLSASHCFIGELPSTWRVRLGSSYPENGGTIHNVLELITHEEYDSSTIDNDVAIVVLSTPAVFSDTIRVARIAGTNYNLPDDTLVTVIGYGVLWAGGPSPDHLRHVDVNLINQELCVERYAYLKSQPGYEAYPDVTDGMLCSGILDVGGKDACQGDSGGPLVHAGDIVVGVTSWGAGCANGTYPGVNARVSKYADWIVRHASV